MADTAAITIEPNVTSMPMKTPPARSSLSGSMTKTTPPRANAIRLIAQRLIAFEAYTAAGENAWSRLACPISSNAR